MIPARLHAFTVIKIVKPDNLHLGINVQGCYDKISFPVGDTGMAFGHTFGKMKEVAVFLIAPADDNRLPQTYPCKSANLFG